jgi:multisubunit Na+/H+ antiporter MnhG subunit
MQLIAVAFFIVFSYFNLIIAATGIVRLPEESQRRCSAV